jgi:hypothetical protein
VESEVYKNFSAAKTVEIRTSPGGEVLIEEEYQWRKREQNKRLSKSKIDD